jgi:TolB-like protein/tRNA A-37 threonylcarbamoyl transferase component Bud32
MPLQTGSRLGPYVVVRSLGRGGMGEVFEARDSRLDRRVAIKTLRPELLSDANARRRFEREAKALSGLSHPNICAVYDVGRHEELDFLVMEYIEGQTLASALDRGALDERTAVRLAAQIAEALGEAHEHGILHRDVKPQNVLVTPRGHAKVLDFGLAKTVSPGTEETATISDVSAAGTVLGTARYMSPEQVRGEDIDARSDIFSLGCVIYELLAGRAAFQGQTAGEIMSGILTKDPVPLERHAPGASSELQRIVRKCIEKDRSRRYQTARDVAIDLDNLQHAAGTGASAEQSAARGARRRHVAAAAALGMALIAIGAMAARVRFNMPAALPPLRTIAILPLKPLASDISENYLGLGIADALITRLSGRSGLAVRPTSAVRRFADLQTDAMTAGGALQVDAILDGSWQREGGRLRVSVNLLRVHDGASLWVDRFDVPSSEVLQVQDRVADELASRLRVEIESGNRAGLDGVASGTRNPAAYDAYLRGQFHLGIRGYSPANRQSTDKAIEFLERAVSLDPRYAQAHAKLGFAYAHAAIFFENTQSLIDRAKEATATAESLQPNLAQVQLNRALIAWSWYEGWRIVDSIRAYTRAATLDPSLTDIEMSAGYAHLGMIDEWRRAGQGVIERDPTNRAARVTFVNEHFLLNLPEQGADAQKRLLDEPPDERFFLLMRRVDQAAPLVEANIAAAPDSPYTVLDLGLLRALQGRHGEADKIVTQAMKTAVRNRGYHHLAYQAAQTYGLAGNDEKTARWLEEAIGWGLPCYPMFSKDTFLDSVRDSPRVRKVLADVKATWEGYRNALRQ